MFVIFSEWHILLQRVLVIGISFEKLLLSGGTSGLFLWETKK